MKIYPSFYLVLATFAHVTVGDAGDWSNSEYKKDSKDFRLKNQELAPYELKYKSKFSENRRHSRKDRMETTQRSLYNKRHNISPSTNKNENSSQESDREGLISHDAGLKKAWKRNMPIRRPARDPVRLGKRMLADIKKKTNRKNPLRIFGIRQNKKRFIPRKADAVEMYRQLLIKSGQLQKFRTLNKTQQIKLLRSLIMTSRNTNREKQPENSLQPWKTTTQSMMKISYSIGPSKTPLDIRREMVSSKYNNANHYRLIGNHGRLIPKPPVVFANGAARKKSSDRKHSSGKKLSGKETHADSLSRQESSLENIQNRHQKPVSTLATASLSSRININGNAFMLAKNSDSIHYRIPMRKNVFPTIKYKNRLSYKHKKGNTGLMKSNESETRKGGDEDESREEKAKEEKGNNEPENDDVEQKEQVNNNKDNKETSENSFRNPNRRGKLNFRFPLNMKMEARPDSRRPVLRNRKYGFARPAMFHNEARHLERRRKTHLPSTVIPLRVYRKEDKGRIFEATRNIPKRSDLRENIAQPPEFVMIKHDNTKGSRSVRKNDQDSSEDTSDAKKKDKVRKYQSFSPPGKASLNIAGDFQYGYRPVTYSMSRSLYGRPDYYDQIPFVDIAETNTRGQTSDENVSSENDQHDGDQQDYRDMHGTDMTVGGDRTIDVHTFYDNNPVYMIPDPKPEDDDDASVENRRDDGVFDHTNNRQDSGSEEQDSPKHFQQTIHKNHDSPDTLLIVIDNQAKSKKKLNDRNENSIFKRVPHENKKVSPVMKADHSYSSGILVILDNQKKSKRNNADIHPALELASNAKQKTALNQKEFYNFTAREKFKERPTVDIQSGSRKRGRSRINVPPKRTSDGFRKSYKGLQHQGRKSALDNLLIELGTKENIFNIRTTNNGIKPSYHARISASKSLQEDRRHDVQADNSSNSTDMERVKEIVANEHRNVNRNYVYRKMHSSSPIETSALNPDRIPDPVLNLKADTDHFGNHFKEVVRYSHSNENEMKEVNRNGNKTVDMVELFVNRHSESNSTLQKTNRNEKLRGIANKTPQRHSFHPSMHILSDKTVKYVKSKYNPKYPSRKHKKISPAYQRGGVDYVYGPLNGISKHISLHSNDEEEKDDESAEEMSPDGVSLYPDIDIPPTGKLTPIYPSQLHDIYDYGNVAMQDVYDDDEEGDDDDDDDINETQVVDVEPLVIPDHPHELEYVDRTLDYHPHLTRGRGEKHKPIIKLHSIHMPESLVHASIHGTEEKTRTKELPLENLNPYYSNFNHFKSIIDLPPDNIEDYHAKNIDYTIDDDDDDDTEEEDDDDDDNENVIENVYPTDVIDHQHAMGNFHGDFQTPFYEISHDHEDGHSSQEAVDTDTGDEKARHFHDLTGIHIRHDDNARDFHETVAGINGNATTYFRSLEKHRNPGHISIRTLYDKLPNNREDILESLEDSPADSNSMGEEVAYIDKKYKFPNLNVHKAVLSDHGEHFKSIGNQLSLSKKAPLPSGLYRIGVKHSLKQGQKEKISDEEITRSLEDAPSDQEFYATSFGRKQHIRGVQFRNRNNSRKGLRGRYRKLPVHFSRIYRIMNKGKKSLRHRKLYKRLKDIHERKARPRISHLGRFQNGSKSNHPLKDRQQKINNDSNNATFLYYEDYLPKSSNSYFLLPSARAIDSEESRADRSSHEHGPGLEDDFRDDTVVTSKGVYYKDRQSGGKRDTFELRHYQIKRMNETRDMQNGTSELSNDDRDKQEFRVDIDTAVSWNESVEHEGLGGKENASWHIGTYKDAIDVPITSENKNGQFGQYDSDSISLVYHGSQAAEFHDYIGKDREKTGGFEDIQGTPESKLPNLEGDSLYHDIYGTPESDLQRGVHYENSYNYPSNVYSDYDYISGTAVSELSQDESLLHGASGALPDGVLTGQETIYSENHYPHPQQHNFMKDKGDGRFRYGEEIVDMNSGMGRRSHSEVGRQRVSYLSNGRDAGKMEPDTQRYQDGRHEDIRKLALDKKISNDKFHERMFKKVEESRPEDANMFGREKNTRHDGAVDNYESKYFASGNGAFFDDKNLKQNLFESFPDATTPGSIQISTSARNANLVTTLPTAGIGKSETREIEKARSQDIIDTKGTWKHHKDIKGSAISGDDESFDLKKMVYFRPGIIKSVNGINANESKDATINLGILSNLSHLVKNVYESALPEDKNITFRTSVAKVNHTIKLEPEREQKVIQENHGRGWHTFDHELPKTKDTKHSSSNKMQTSHIRSLIISNENKDKIKFLKVKPDNETVMPGETLTSLHDTGTEGLQNESISQNRTEAVSSAAQTKQSSDKDEQHLGPLTENTSEVDHHSNMRTKATIRQENVTKVFAPRFRTKITNWGRSGHSITHKVPDIFEMDGRKTSRVKNKAHAKISDVSPTRKTEIVDSIQKQKIVLPEPGIQLNQNALEGRNQYNLKAEDIFQHILPDILHNAEPDRSQRHTTVPTTKAPESINADWKRRPVTYPVNPTGSAAKQKFLSGPEISRLKFADRSPSFETEKELFRDLKRHGVPDSLDLLNNRHTISSSSINDAVSQTDEKMLPYHSVRVNVSELESSLYTKNHSVLDELADSDIMDLSHFEGGSRPSFQPPSVTSSGVATVADFSGGHLKAETLPLFSMLGEPLTGGNESVISEIPFQNTDMMDLSSDKSPWINVDDNASLSRLDPFYKHSAPESSQIMGDNENGKQIIIGNDGFTDELTISGVPVDNRKMNWPRSSGNVKSHTGESSSWYTQSKLTRMDDANGKVDKDAVFQLVQTNEPDLSEIGQLNIKNISEITMGYKPTNSDIMSGISNFNELVSSDTLPGISRNNNLTDIFTIQVTSNSELPVNSQSPGLLQNSRLMDKDVVHSWSAEKDLTSSHSVPKTFQRTGEIKVHRIGDIYSSNLSTKSLPGDNGTFRKSNGRPGDIQIDSQPATMLPFTGKQVDIKTDPGDNKVDLPSFIGISRSDRLTDLHPLPSVTKTETLTSKDAMHGIIDGSDPINTEILTRILHGNTANTDTLAGISLNNAAANRGSLIGKSHRSDSDFTDPSHRTASAGTDTLTETIYKSNQKSMYTQEAGLSLSNRTGMDPITRLSDNSDPLGIDTLVEISLSTNPKDTNSMIGVLNSNDPTRITYRDPMDTGLSKISHSSSPVDTDTRTGISHISDSTDVDILSGKWKNSDLTPLHTLTAVSHSSNTSGADKLSKMFHISDRLDIERLSGTSYTNDLTDGGISHTSDSALTRTAITNQGHPASSDTLTDQLYSGTSYTNDLTDGGISHTSDSALTRTAITNQGHPASSDTLTLYSGTPGDLQSFSLISQSNNKIGIDMLSTSSRIDNLTGIDDILPSRKPMQTLTDSVKGVHSDPEIILNRSQTDMHTLDGINSGPDSLSIPTGLRYSSNPTVIDTMLDIKETTLLHSLPEISHGNDTTNIGGLILPSDSQNLHTLHDTFYGRDTSDLHTETIHSSDTKRIDTMEHFREPLKSHTDTIHNIDLTGTNDISLINGLTHLHTDELNNVNPSSVDEVSKVIGSTLSQSGIFHRSDPSSKDRIYYVPADKGSSTDPGSIDKMDHISDITRLHTDAFHSSDPTGLDRLAHVSDLSHSQTYMTHGNDLTSIDGVAHIQDPTNLYTSSMKVNHSDMTNKTLSPETSQSSGPSDLPDTFAETSHSSDLLKTDRLLSPIDPSSIDRLTGVPLSPDLFTLPRISYSDPLLDLHTLSDKNLLTIHSNQSQSPINASYVARQTGKDTSSTLSQGDGLRDKQALFGMPNTDTQTEIHNKSLTGDQTYMHSLPETSYIGNHSDGHISQSPSSHADRLNQEFLSSELSFIDGLTAVDTMPKLSLSDLQTGGLPKISHAEGLALSEMLDTVGLTDGLTLPGSSKTKTLTDQHPVTHSQTIFESSPSQGEDKRMDKVNHFVTGISSKRPIDVSFEKNFQSSWRDLLLNHSRGFNLDTAFEMEQIHQPQKMNESSLVDTTSENPLTKGVGNIPLGSSHLVLGDQQLSLESFFGGTGTHISDTPKTSEPDHKVSQSWAAPSLSSSVDSNQRSQNFQTLLDLPSTFLFGQLMNGSLHSTNLDLATADKKKVIPLIGDSTNSETQDSTIEMKNMTSSKDTEVLTSPHTNFTSKVDSISGIENLTLLHARVIKTPPTVSDMSAPFDLSSLFGFADQTRKLKSERTTSKVTASDKRPIFLTIQSMGSSNPSLDLDPDLIPVVQHVTTTRVPPKYISTDITSVVKTSDVPQTSVRTTRNEESSSTHAFPSTLPKENTSGQFSSDGGVAAENIPLPKFSSVTSRNTMHSGTSYSDPYLTLLPVDADTSFNRSFEETHKSHSQNDSTSFTNPFVLSTQTGSRIVKSGTVSGILSLKTSSNLVSSESENQNFYTGIPMGTNSETSQITKQFDRSAITEFPAMIEDFDKAYLLKFHIPKDQSVTKFEEPLTVPLTTTDRPTEKTFWWMTSTSDTPDVKSSLMSLTLPESTFIHSVVPKICADCVNHIWEDRQGFMLGMYDAVDFKDTTFKRDPDASYHLVDSTYEVIRSLNLNLVQRQICKCILSKQPIQKIRVLCEHRMNGRLIHLELPNKRRDTEMKCHIKIYNGTWQGSKSCKEGQKYCDHMFGTRFGECTYVLGRNDLLKYYSMCNTVLCREAGDMKQWKKDACDVLDALAHECELVGTKVAWREVTKCYKQCPENMEFKTNVSACRKTCSNLDVGFSCATNQTESRCDCQEGFVLSQETCIPMQECGCTYQGHYINIGETLSLPGCKTLVTCIADGNGWSQIKLIEIPGCSARQSCQMVNGSYGCIVQCGGEVCHENATCEEDRCLCNAGLYGNGVTTCLSTNDTCTCLVSGLSRYRTYDGQMLNYVATCPMELTRTLDNSNPSSFAVYGTTLYNSEQMMMFGTRRYRNVNITINGLKIYMDTIGDIYVDEVKTALPFQNFQHNVSASSSGGWITVCSGDGVYVSYDRKHRVKIFLPETYREKLTGMCGNCNGEREDDFYEKHKEMPSTVDLVGASYMLNSSFTCGQVSSINKCPEGVERCEIMRSGAFSGCHPYLDPGLVEAYYESCMQMTCAFKAHKDYLKKLTCAALESLDTECMSRGYTVEWRSQTICSISCCRPMVYNKYMNVSGSNCVSSPPVCSAQPVDGCVCGEGYVLDNNKCVLPQDCGCWYNNSIYIQLGETYHVPGCHLMIQCRKVATGKKKLVVTHLENGCGNNSKCVLKDHKHQCVCEERFARNKNDTLCQKIPECGDHPVDVVFVVDISGSINMTGLNSTKHFLAHFINSTNIGPNNMQVSILLFNDKPHNLFQLNRYSEKQQMLTALHTIGPPEGTTYLGRALVFVALVSLQEKMGSRENVNRAVIILTDGILHDAERAERWSALLRRQKQAELFAIGVGEADPAQLQRLTRNKNNVFYVRDYEKLNSIMDNLLQGVCK